MGRETFLQTLQLNSRNQRGLAGGAGKEHPEQIGYNFNSEERCYNQKRLNTEGARRVG